MAHIEIEIHPVREPEIKDILIGLLSEENFEGFEELPNSLKAYITAENFNEEVFEEIIKTYQLSYTKKTVEDQNWNAVWEADFKPVVIDDYVAIRANFHEPVKNVQYEIIITPKMSFGTGHHATTYLMMSQMKTIGFERKEVLDFGTGTGILAILANKLGAKDIIGIDNDDWSIENAKENIAFNETSGITIIKADHAGMERTFDVILANINKNIILQNLEKLISQLNPNGVLLLSGLLDTDEPEMINAVKSKGIQHYEVFHREKWICINCRV